MPFELANFQDSDLDAGYVEYLVDTHTHETASRYSRLWDYFRNPLVPASTATSSALNTNSRPYFQAQEAGLPARITGVTRFGSAQRPTDLQRKEVVIENDIAWRVHTMVDYLFGHGITIRSLADNADLADLIEKTLATVLEASGGISFLQELALFGSVYGFSDIALRAPTDVKAAPASASALPTWLPAAAAHSFAAARRSGNSTESASTSNQAQESVSEGMKTATSSIACRRVIEAAKLLRLEAIEAPRIIPVLSDTNYQDVRYWVQRFWKHPTRLSNNRRAWLRMPWSTQQSSEPACIEAIEILGASWWQLYEDRKLVAEGPNLLGRPPIVHIQNVALPGSYAGIGDVEPLLPIQDELNTRLSDRAQRVTYQSFKMYLGKGIDDFLERPVGPGQMWATQNLDASIEEFGSDTGSPSEDAHIEQCRQAMDKVSGVTPLAAGLIGGNVGHLSSATALKVVLSGLLAKTARKRLTYSAGVKQIADLVLHWLALTGKLPTRPEDRRIEIHWPNTLPIDESEQLRSAQAKLQLGVPPERVLAELGYDRQTLSNK